MSTERAAESFRRTVCALLMLFAAPATLCAETVGVFCDSTVAQIKFAAGDVKTALESKSFTVEMIDLSQLSSTYTNKKVILALSSNIAVATLLTAQGATAPTGLGEQAYALQTTTQPQMSYWVLGGDVNGVMYGGFQAAESIKFDQFAAAYSLQESPYLKQRGIKLNLPMDGRSPTYPGVFKGTSFSNAIANVWDLSFWTAWFDEQARNRYNMFSLWTDHPFTAMIKMPDYPNVALQNVQDSSGAVIKAMTIDEKIVFWKQVMAYAHSRGFKFVIVNWNIYTHGATGQYGINETFTTAETITYMRKCMTQLLETYPDLDGFGVTAGENMGAAGESQKEQWLWNTYGLGMKDYATANPTRRLTFIHRFHQTGAADIMTNFQPLVSMSNVTVDMLYKYCQAHLYSAPDPTWITTIDGNIPASLTQYHMKTWLTLRNDDMYLLHWGNPEFARAFIAGLPDKDLYLAGYYIGSDGFSPTRVFEAKDALLQNDLEIKRLWYREVIWGRLTYNPATSNDVFIKTMTLKYPEVSANDLFNAWSLASKGIPLVTELISGTWNLDYEWWPEACLSSAGFCTISGLAGCKPCNGSSMCSIASSASGSCSGGKTSYQIADSIEKCAQAALATLNGMNPGANTGLQINIENLKALSYLSLYYSEKIRGATYNSAKNTASARTAMGNAYCHWIHYADLMDAMFFGMNMQRVSNLSNWHSLDDSVLAEYSVLGGIGTPTCMTGTIGVDPVVEKKPETYVFALSGRQISFYLPVDNSYSLSIFTNAGKKVADISRTLGKKGINKVVFGTKLGQGVYIIHLTCKSVSLVKLMLVVFR